MKEEVTISYTRRSVESLPDSDKELIKQANACAENAYAPFSKFKVGAALRMSDDSVFVGSNQENVAYPSGLCAERVALFAASAQHPDLTIKTLAVVTQSHEILEAPIPPCGACRQVMAEYEIKQKQPIRILLVGVKEVIELESTLDLLPLVFNPAHLLR